MADISTRAAQRFKLTVEYDGRSFVGWQRQKDGMSVQQALESAVEGFDPTPAETGKDAAKEAGKDGASAVSVGVGRITGAGRTDAGVHATGQVAHVDIHRPMTADKVQAAINHYLRPHAVSVVAVDTVDGDFHARFSATDRHYRYIIENRRAPLTFARGLVWQVTQSLDADAMDAAAQQLVGHHDFTTFRHVHCQAKSPLKTLDYIRIRREDDRVIMTTGARSFLHSQVRSMIGCLMLVGRGQWSAADLKDALDAADRSRLGLNAPPDGLYLTAVGYAGQTRID